MKVSFYYAAVYLTVVAFISGREGNGIISIFVPYTAEGNIVPAYFVANIGLAVLLATYMFRKAENQMNMTAYTMRVRDRKKLWCCHKCETYILLAAIIVTKAVTDIIWNFLCGSISLSGLFQIESAFVLIAAVIAEVAYCMCMVFNEKRYGYFIVIVIYIIALAVSSEFSPAASLAYTTAGACLYETAARIVVWLAALAIGRRLLLRKNFLFNISE